MPTVSWHVLGDEITQSTTLKPGGTGITDVYDVPYVIDSGPAMGHRGTVQIAASAFNEANVKQAIDAAVGAVHGVAGLTS